VFLLDPLAIHNDRENLDKILKKACKKGVKLVFVVLDGDDSCYGNVKYAADTNGVISQCLKSKNVTSEPPRGYITNVMLKVIAKLGGINHVLASRLPAHEVDDHKRRRISSSSSSLEGVFQDPPASLSWVFDEPTMMMGLTSSHSGPDAQKGPINNDGPSYHALVGSMDGSAGQYCAHISATHGQSKAFDKLTEGMESMLNSFYQKNKAFPKHIILFRDGLPESEFKNALETELPAFKNALELCGLIETKITMVVCTQGHHTRFFYESEDGKYTNPCPGIVLDASGDRHSVTSTTINEFILNSHAPIQGTCNPYKYSIIHDEIGFKVFYCHR
jgi:hypothetical protein